VGAHPLEHFAQQGLLVVELEVDRALGAIGLRRDVVEACPDEAPVGEMTTGDVENPLSPAWVSRNLPVEGAGRKGTRHRNHNDRESHLGQYISRIDARGPEAGSNGRSPDTLGDMTGCRL